MIAFEVLRWNNAKGGMRSAFPPYGLFIIRRSPYGEAARVIGRVSAAPPGRVTVKTVIGTTRLLDPPSGDLLPRIC